MDLDEIMLKRKGIKFVFNKKYEYFLILGILIIFDWYDKNIKET
jgi:hypothetical protein